MTAKTYTALEGDTFESVARKIYGDPALADLLRQANPQGITPGSILTVPRVGRESSTPAVQANTPDEVAIILGGQRIRFWTDVSIGRRLDGIADISVAAPWEPDEPEMREFFRPFSYPSIEVFVGGALVFTGTGIAPEPTLGPDRRAVTWSGYSLPGVLQDCTIPTTATDEFTGKNLREIATSVAGVHGTQTTVAPGVDPGAIFDHVAVEPGTTSWAFLAKLAKQRGLILTDDAQGRLVISNPGATGQAIGLIAEGSAGLVSLSPQFNGQAYFSSVTAVSENLYQNPGGSYTAKNPRTTANRPMVIRTPDSDGATVQSAAESALGRMFADAATYSAEVPGWRGPDGQIWTPGALVEVLAPGAMVFEPYVLQIRSVRLNQTPTGRRAQLELMLPGALAGQVPEVLPWDG